MDVKLMYNPFFNTTKLYIDGSLYTNESGRLYSYLNMPKKPMEELNTLFNIPNTKNIIFILSMDYTYGPSYQRK